MKRSQSYTDIFGQVLTMRQNKVFLTTSRFYWVRTLFSSLVTPITTMLHIPPNMITYVGFFMGMGAVLSLVFTREESLFVSTILYLSFYLLH